jgi:hypothetical protein
MGSIGPECLELKGAYDACFNAWFTSSFLKAEGKSDLSSCDALLNQYTACVKRVLKSRNVDLVEIEKEHLGTSRERSIPKS